MEGDIPELTDESGEYPRVTTNVAKDAGTITLPVPFRDLIGIEGGETVEIAFVRIKEDGHDE